MNEAGASQIEGIILSDNIETEGFDFQAGKTWVYPTNYTLRDYQYNIIQEALLNNTMVSLPTGLGKTFIAAVVMYNFYRWYPNGKIIFMAPTRPLVKQQIEACYNIMAIPKDVTAELTGTKIQTYRKDIWKEKRVFFITPQILQNDLTLVTQLGNQIKCLVFDEAHKAKGNHAYCEVVRKLVPQNKYFRVLGLSASPGNTLQDILEVIHNLLISHLEIRTDDSPDVTPYVFQRSLETVVIPLDGMILEVRSDYMKILERYTRVLVNHRVITGNCALLTKGKIFMTLKDYQEKNKYNKDGAYSEIMRNLHICITLYHGFELLIRHGLRGFLSFFEEHAENPILRGNIELYQIMQKVSEFLGPPPNIEPLPDGSIPKISENSKFGHPKFYKLRDILSGHFNEVNDNDSRAIVFCEYKESVMEAYALLVQYRPLIKPRIFLGQGAITQKQQINVIKAFKQGECNTLISTCIGEEGLDIGDVDLIICFDINNKSPVRMVQRMGRTGRKRQGRVVILVTEGKEQQTLKECLIHKQNLTNHILQSSALYKQMYSENPRMVPEDITPTCHKIFITVNKSPQTKLPKKKSSTLRDLLNKITNKKSDSNLLSQNLDDKNIEINNCIPNRTEYFNKENPLSFSNDIKLIDFSKRIEKVRILQPTGDIAHSKNSHLLVSLLQFAESKKFNIPLSQVPITATQTKGKLLQADIRSMFVKSSIPGQPPNTKEEETVELKQVLQLLHTEISTYLTLESSENRKCNICDHLFDCLHFTYGTKEINVRNWVEPEMSIFNDLTIENLGVFAENLSLESNKPLDTLNHEEVLKISKSDAVFELIKSELIKNSNNIEDNNVKLQPSPFKPPNNLQEILNKCEISFAIHDSTFNNAQFTQLEDYAAQKLNNKNEICNITSVIDNEVEFVNSAHCIQDNAKNNYMKCMENLEQNLSFFKIKSLEELFEESSLQSIDTKDDSLMDDSFLDSQKTIIYLADTGDITNNKRNSDIHRSNSPILSSYEARKKMRSHVQKCLFNTLLPTTITDKAKDKFLGESKENYKQCRPNLARLSTLNKNSKDKLQVNLDNTKFSDDESVPDIIDTSLENVFETVAYTGVFKKDNKVKNNILETAEVLEIVDNLETPIKFDRDERINCNNQGSNEKVTSAYVDKLHDFCDDSFLEILFDDSFEKDIYKQNEKDKSSKIIDTNRNKNENNLNINNQGGLNKNGFKPITKVSTIVKDIKTQEENSTLIPCFNQSKTVNISEVECCNTSNATDETDITNIIDLTMSPERDSINNSPTLLKSQGSIFSQFKSQKSLNFQASIISMDWPKKLSNKKNVTTNLSIKHKEQINTILQVDPLEIDNDTEINETFTTTFNRKKPSPKCASNILPSSKLSLNKNNKCVDNNTMKIEKLTTTPKKMTRKPATSNRIVDSNSDDDFELPKRQQEWLRKRPKGIEKYLLRKELESRNKKAEDLPMKSKRKKAQDCPYIDFEAVVDVEDESITITDSDDNEDTDKFEESFVNDESELVENTTAIHAHYLESVKSPLLNRGKFKIPNQLKHCPNVYSQQVDETNNTYINDSFCVNSQDAEFQDPEDMSELDVAELILKQKSKRKLRSNTNLTTKRRRILECSSTSSSDTND